MPFSFKLQNIQSRQFICIAPSKIENEFIDYTAQGIVPHDPRVETSAVEWITKFKPTETLSAYSRPMQLYNPFISRFFGDTEEITNITDNHGKTGSIAGTMNFESPDIAKFFTFRRLEADKFKIYQHESENNSLNLKRLAIDVKNLSRIIITLEDFENTRMLDDTWTIVYTKK